MKNSLLLIGVLNIALVFSDCSDTTAQLNKDIFYNEYNCDSITVETYNFMLDEDSSFYSLSKKVPFEFKLYIDTNYVFINKKKYYYFMAGINVDTIGLLNVSNNAFLLKKHIKSKKAVLFKFSANINDFWKIEDGGYFNNYRIELKDIKYNKSIKDNVYHFRFHYEGIKLPNGYYFVSFKVSQNHGIIQYRFDNGVNCRRTYKKIY